MCDRVIHISNKKKVQLKFTLSFVFCLFQKLKLAFCSTFTKGSEMAEAMKLTDLNDDCLRMILEKLNLVDLTSAAITNKRINEVAILTFVHTYSQCLIEVNSTCISAWKNGRNITCEKHYAFKPDAQAFLYYFGEHISRLSLQFDKILRRGPNLAEPSSDNNFRPRQIERILTMNCQNLVELKLNGIADEDGFNFLESGNFPKLEKLSIYSCTMLSRKFDMLCAWFPAVTHLELVNSGIASDGRRGQDRYFQFGSSPHMSVIRNFQRLRYLKFYSEPSAIAPFVQSILPFHRGLHSLSIGVSHYNGNQYVPPQVDFPSNIQNLEISNLREHLFDFRNLQPNSSLKKLKINTLLNNPEYFLLRVFTRLEEIELAIRGLNLHRSRRHLDPWIQSILLARTLKKVVIKISGRKSEGWHLIDRGIFLHFLMLPNLEEMELHQAGESISVDTVQEFLGKCENLKRLTLVYYSNNRGKREQFLLIDFGAKWTVREDFLAIIIEKKC